MASERIITIPHDLIIDILRRLPAKSLGRFRCVSKDWLSLLSEPLFIKTHQKTINRNHLILVNNRSIYSLPVNYHNTLSRPTKVDLFTHHPFNFHGSCNGLVLASDVYGDLVVFNPTTRDFVKLPETRKDGNNMVYGFGYDYVTDDYKVVAMPFYSYYIRDFLGSLCIDLENRMIVYSLRTNAWRQAINPSSYHTDRKNSSGVLVNGFLHWIGRKGSHSPVIVAFSLADEKFNELSSPEDVIISKTECNLVALGEKLAIFNELKGDIWLMNEYGVRSSWTKIVIHGFNGSPMDKEEMIFYDDGKIMFLLRNRMMLYNIEEGTFCKSFVISYMDFAEFKCGYVESLVSPKFSLTKINKCKRRFKHTYYFLGRCTICLIMR